MLVSSSETYVLWKISGQIFGFFSSFLSNRRLQIVLDGKSSQEYPLMLEFLKGPFLFLHFSYYRLMTFLMLLRVILLSMLMMLLSTNEVSDLLEQLELTSELESDLRGTVDWGRK